ASVREAAGNGRLKRESSTAHVPRAVIELGLQEEAPAALDSRIGAAQARADAQGIHRLRGGECVARQGRQLRPATIGALPGEERPGERLQLVRGLTSPRETEELINP